LVDGKLDRVSLGKKGMHAMKIRVWQWILVFVLFSNLGSLGMEFDFTKGLSSWQRVPDVPGCAELEQRNGIPVAVVRGMGKNGGFQTRPLRLGVDLSAEKPYEVMARFWNLGVERGVVGFSVCCNDSSGRRLVQHSCWSSGECGAEPHAQERRCVVGPGSLCPYPAGTDHLVVRFSFWSKDGAAGTLAIERVVLTEQELKEDAWPPSIVVTCGDLSTRFEARSFWTPYRLDYRGVRLGKDSFGSHWGTTVTFRGMRGFVGSGHRENEDEVVESVELLRDGEKVDVVALGRGKTELALTGREFLFRKRSSLCGKLRLVCETRLTGEVLEETVTMRCDEDLPMSLVYHFMHPWLVAMSDYLAEGLDGKIIAGEFVGDGGGRIEVPVKWSAVYSRQLGKGTVTSTVETPQGYPWKIHYWDRKDIYRKHYFVAFQNATIPPGIDLRYRLRTRAFECDAESWHQRAMELGRRGIVTD
jgi:hypothetical protein